jgi:hypothetical protein
VEVFAVRKDFLLMAFVHVVPKGAEACSGDDAKIKDEVRALYVRAREGVEGLAFDSRFASTSLFRGNKKARVVFPAVAPTIPVFEVHYELEQDDDTSCGAKGEEQIGKYAEAYHLRALEQIGDPFSIDTTPRGPHGCAVHRTTTKLRWIAGKTATSAWLVQTTVVQEQDYGACEGGGSASASHNCSRTTKLVAEVKDDGTGEADESLLAKLRRKAGLPRDRTGERESVCKGLGVD